MPYDLKKAAEIEAAEETKFFEYGEVKIDLIDHVHRQSLLEMCMPNCLFQAVTPALLGAGYVDSFRTRDPLAVWLPKYGTERFNSAAATVDSPEARVNQIARDRIEETMKTFQGLGSLFKNPADLIPMLPMGVYVQFQYRCRIDNIPNVLYTIDSILNVAGVAEFQWALACVLKQVLIDHDLWINRSKQ